MKVFVIVDCIGRYCDMRVRHRGIYPDRFDAPFGLGTLVWARTCTHGCPDCFHQDRFGIPVLVEEAEDIIKRVKQDPFTNGVVLGGFEWTEQYEELIAIIEAARSEELEVILYTHYTIDELSTRYPELLKYKQMYVKCGEYDNTKLDPLYTSYGVPLASTNQRIYKIGTDC